MREVEGFQIDKVFSFITAASFSAWSEFMQGVPEGREYAHAKGWRYNPNSPTMPIPRFLYERNKQEMMKVLLRNRTLEVGMARENSRNSLAPIEIFFSKVNLEYESSLKYHGLIIEDDKKIQELYDFLIEQKDLEKKRKKEMDQLRKDMEGGEAKEEEEDIKIESWLYLKEINPKKK